MHTHICEYFQLILADLQSTIFIFSVAWVIKAHFLKCHHNLCQKVPMQWKLDREQMHTYWEKTENQAIISKYLGLAFKSPFRLHMAI